MIENELTGGGNPIPIHHASNLNPRKVRVASTSFAYIFHPSIHIKCGVFDPHVFYANILLAPQSDQGRQGLLAFGAA